MDFAERAAVRALDFLQGNIQSLRDAKNDFTPAGWTGFMKSLDGFLDDQGAPTFRSDFAPSGKAVIVKEQNGTYYLKIPGTLTQTQNQSRTIYRRSEIQLEIRGTPPKIQRLETIYKAR